MEKPSPQEQEHEHAHDIEDEDRGKKCHQFKGIRLRKWGSWVSEIRMPRSRDKLWLGSYPTAEQAARAYDAAVYCLRGANAKFNFPKSVPSIPSASSLSRPQIQDAAAQYAMYRLPSSPPSLKNINNTAMEETASPSISASVSETELSSDSHHVLEEHELDFWECLFEKSDGNDGGLGLGLNLERMPSIDDASALELSPTTWQKQQQEDEQMNTIIDTTELWYF